MLKILYETHLHKSANLIKVTSSLSYAFCRKHFIFLSCYALKSNLLVLISHFHKFTEKAKECGVQVAIWVNFKGSQQSHSCPVPPGPTSHRATTKGAHSKCVLNMKVISHGLLLVLSENVNYQRKCFQATIINCSCLGHPNLRGMISQGQ